MKDIIYSGKSAEEEYKKLKQEGRLLFETIVGSHSYGLNVPESDVDKKFVYIANNYDLLTNQVPIQLNVTDDYVGYEIGRFIEFLGKCLKNITENVFAIFKIKNSNGIKELYNSKQYCY